MRITIEHREALSAIGRIHFFVDTTVEFSEAERAVIRNRQLGDHFIEVDGDTPWFRSLTGYKIAVSALYVYGWLAAVALLPAGILISIFRLHDGWWGLLIVSLLGAYLYRKYLERQFKKSTENRHISATALMRDGRFTVYEPDAYLAAQAEKSIATQLNSLKTRLVAVAPALAEKQVYARES